MNKQFQLAIYTLIMIVLVSHLASSLIISSVDTSNFAPGKQNTVTLTLENDENEDATDVTLNLELSKVPFSTIGTSEESLDEIRENRKDDFTFTLRVFQDAKPGDYQIPYTISYNDSVLKKTKQGTFGVRVIASPELTFTTSVENPVVGQTGKVTLKIINKGLADAKFVSLRISPQGFTLLSEKDIYIGSISSDDFETATFDVIFNNENPSLSGVVEYKDFEDNSQIKTINLPLTVYTKERALELGIIKKSNTLIYVIVVVVIIIIFFVWRAIQKRRRLNRRAKEKGI